MTEPIFPEAPKIVYIRHCSLDMFCLHQAHWAACVSLSYNIGTFTPAFFAKEMASG